MYRTMLIPHSLPHNGVRRFSKQAYSPECVELEFCELRLLGILGRWDEKADPPYAVPLEGLQTYDGL
jgi:hypothetical protein